MMTQKALCCMAWTMIFTVFLGWAGPLAADDAFYRLPIEELNITEGQLPASNTFSTNIPWRLVDHIVPDVVLEGPGEAYLEMNRTRWRRGLIADGALCVRAPEGQDVQGKIILPRYQNTAWIMAFKIPQDAASVKANPDTEVKQSFYMAKLAHYQNLLNRDIPGGAWFRHQAMKARVEGEMKDAPRNAPRWNARNTSDIVETYDLFSGGMALSENLQLDRVIGGVHDTEATEDLGKLEGITVQAMDWQALLDGKQPARDFLSAHVPHDQYAIYFPSFQAMIDLMDEADANGTPVLQLFESRSEDARTKDRLQRQLCLEVSELARMFGPAVVNSVAMTSSDTYLRRGSDVAVLFEARNPGLLKAFLLQKHYAAFQKGEGTVKKVTGETGGLAYQGVVTPCRCVSSYFFQAGNVCGMTNSLHQLKCMADVAAKKTPSQGSLDEYAYFRSLYPVGGDHEAAFVMITDAAIRRLCSPRWRITASRRTRVAGILAELQAEHAEALAAGKVNQVKDLAVKWHVPGAGPFQLTPKGVISTAYNSLNFMTPIAEIPIARVTKREAAAYRTWRNRYQDRWRRYFDPVGIRFSLTDDAIGTDITVMPLIMGTEYNQLVELTRGVTLKPLAGDPHDALLQYVMAVNKKAPLFRMSAGFLMSMNSAIGTDPFSWLGESIAIYMDDDPFWEGLTKSDNPDQYIEDQFYRMPLGIRFASTSALKLTLFLTGIRGMVNQSAPGLVNWETLKHKEQAYVKISPTESSRGMPEKMAIFYAATPDFLLVTLNEALLKRALDRSLDEKASAGPPWLGESANLRAKKKALSVIQKLSARHYRDFLQRQSWGNIPILNALRRAFPGQDPCKVYRRLWHAELRCPGGGAYEWAAAGHTMSSTVYGHPAGPKAGPAMLPVFEKIIGADAGLTFDGQGARAVMKINRKPDK